MAMIEITNSNVFSPSIGLYSQTDNSTPITNTTTPGSLINGGIGSLLIPANGFRVGDSFIAYFSGYLSSQNNATLEIHCNAGSATLADTGIMTLVTTTSKIWEMHINFTVRSIGATGVASIATSGRFFYSKNSNNTPESIGFYNLNNTTFDTTIANTLAVTAEWGAASPLDSISTEIFNLYKIY